MTKPSIKYITTADLFSIHFVPTLIVFLVMMVLIGFSWRTASQTIIDTRNEEVDVRSQLVETNISQRYAIYDNALRSGAGLYAGTSFVDRTEWRTFVNALDIEKQLPAMMGFGYIEVLNSQTLPAYVSRMQAEGFTDFRVRSNDPNRGVYASITYIEPMNERNVTVIGGDVYNEENRREAIEHARDQSTTTVTDVVNMLQSDGVDRQNGITVYFPIYRDGAATDTLEERREAIEGFIYAPLRADILFGDIFKDNDANFNVQIYDGEAMNDTTLLYQRFPTDQGEPYVHIKNNAIQVGDQSWTISYSVRNGIVSDAIRDRPNNLAFGGVVFSMLVAGLVYLLLQRRSRQLVDSENRKLDYAKDSMLSLASHQLRTPATGVKQYLGMVLEGFVGDITDDQKELLQRANDSNERQLRIINEFLYLAKADAGRVVITPQLFDIGDLADSIATEMHADIAQAGHELKIIQRAKVVNVYADPHSTRMIIENLISNAIKYTPSGGKITLTVRKGRKYSSVSVEDNGVGIARKDFAKLFKQFSRIPNELTRQETGSGIGLYLADYLAELNGGKITVESKRHVGSTFTVQLPATAVKNVTAT